MINRIRLLLLLSSAFCLHVNAEVQQVVIKWNPIPCKNECPKLLQDRLQKAKGVSTVEVHAEEGWASIEWDKKIPFSFVPLNWALRYVGVREKYLRVKVRGKVRGAGASYSITSEGDGTNFVLFNRAVPVDPPQYVNLFNPSNRVLTPDIIEKLEQAKKGNQTVVIDGPIFMPERSPPDPLRLVVENISVDAPKPNAKPATKYPTKVSPGFGTSQSSSK